MIKFLRIIVLCCFPLWVSAEPAIKQELIRFDAELKACHNNHLDKNTEQQLCYQHVLRQILLKYYNLNAEQAQQLSEKTIQDINEEYRSIYINNKYCNPDCGQNSVLQATQDATNEIPEYIQTILLYFYVHHVTKGILEKGLFDEFITSVSSANRPGTGFCKNQHKEKICSDYQNESCLQNNIKTAKAMKECYLNYLAQLLQEHYGRNEVQAHSETNDLWQKMYQRNWFFFHNSIDASKENDLNKELTTLIVTLISLQNYIYDMEIFIRIYRIKYIALKSAHSERYPVTHFISS